MHVTIRYFAAAREATGRAQDVLTLEAPATVADAFEAACTEHPALRPLADQLRFALDEEFAALEAPIEGDTTLALIPPVGGG